MCWCDKFDEWGGGFVFGWRGGGGGGGEVVINGFWSRLGHLEQNAIIFRRQVIL